MSEVAIRNTDLLCKLQAEFESELDLQDELNEKFAAMNGRKNGTEFSRCVVFFHLGRLFEINKAAALAGATPEEGGKETKR